MAAIGSAPLRDFDLSPEPPRAGKGLPRNDDNSPMRSQFPRRRRRHDPVQGAFTAHAPSDFRVRTLDGIADDWTIDYGHSNLSSRERPHDGRRGVGGRSRLSAPTNTICRRAPGQTGTRYARAMTSWGGIGGRRTLPWPQPIRRARQGVSNLGQHAGAARKGAKGASTSPKGRMRFRPGGAAQRAAGREITLRTREMGRPAPFIRL